MLLAFEFASQKNIGMICSNTVNLSTIPNIRKHEVWLSSFVSSIFSNFIFVFYIIKRYVTVYVEESSFSTS